MTNSEINKLKKELNKLPRNNLKERAEICNYIGEKHSERQEYQEAIHYHSEALQFNTKDGDRMGMALANRYLGECHSVMSDFEKAKTHIMEYYRIVNSISIENKNPKTVIELCIEKQRACTTFARFYLLQAQVLTEEEKEVTQEFRGATDEAERLFVRATKMADRLESHLTGKEYPEMKARLLLNMALVKELKGNYQDAILKLKEAIEICTEHKLKEDLYLSQFNLANIYRQRGLPECLTLLDESLTTAKQLRSVKSKFYIFEAYIQKGLILLERGVFQKEAAMKCFYLAYQELSGEKSSHSEEVEKASRLLRISYVIYINSNKIRDDSLSGLELIKAHDKLGDCFTELRMYPKAISYYEQALIRAISSNRPRGEKASIYISIAESYSDNLQYDKAIEYYEKELECRQGNDEEQCRTLIKIAQMREYNKDDKELIIGAYEKAYGKAGDNPGLRQQVLKNYVPYLKSNDRGSSLHRKLEKTLTDLESYADLDHDKDADDEEESAFENDYPLEEILAEFQDDGDDEEGFRYLHTSGRAKRTLVSRSSKKFAVNDYGETPLHQASINGDLKTVEKLLDNDHPVNPTDNSDWLPIHEAANNGHTEIVDLLIRRGAKIDARGWMGITPLHDAARNGRLDIVRLLVKNRANTITLDDDACTALDYLIKWKQENQNNITGSQLAEYQETKLELEDAMSKVGFNFQEHRVEKFKNRGAPTRANKYETLSSKSASTTNSRGRTRTAESPPPNPVKEYKSVITDLRRTANNKKHTIPSKASEAGTSLGAPNLKADMKDWMIDDVSGNKRGRKRFCRDGLFDDDEESEEEPVDDMEIDEVTIVDDRKGKNAECSISDDDDEIRTTTSKRPKRCPSPVFSDDGAAANRSSPIERPSSPSMPFLKDPVAAYILARDDSSSIEGSERSTLISDSSSTAPKKQVRIEIEGKTMFIPTKSGDKVQWLVDQVSERCMSFADVKSKPFVELYGESQDIPLWGKDLIQDVVQGRLRAVIKSWNLPPIFDRYVEACKEEKLEPLPRSIGLQTSQLSLKLDNAKKLNKLDLSNCRIPREHVVPLIKSLMREDIQELNLSASNICPDDDNCLLFCLLPTLARLTKLSLSCCGLDNKKFESMCRLKLPSITYICISYNSINIQDIKFLNSLDELSQNADNLKCLEARWNEGRLEEETRYKFDSYKFSILLSDQSCQ